MRRVDKKIHGFKYSKFVAVKFPQSRKRVRDPSKVFGDKCNGK